MILTSNVIAPVRQSAGLGCPLEFYTQNVPECSYSVVKRNAGHTKKEWPDFCVSLGSTTQNQERELTKVLHEMGKYRLSSDFKHLEVKADRWLGMTSNQRDTHIKRSFNTPLDKLGKPEDDESDHVETDDQGDLSIGYQESAIPTLSVGNLKQMWSFASKFLKEKQGVLLLPWDVSGSQRLVFDGEGSPPCQVQIAGFGAVKCSYQKYKSASICPHSLAVA